MPTITAVLRAVAPRANPAFVAASEPIAGAIMARWGIVSVNAQAMLIAQKAHESGGFRQFEENAKYSAARLRQVFPKRFPNDAAAAACAHNPQAFCNTVYANRMGNGGPASGDGYRYRGSHCLQHTGAAEFGRVEKRTGLPVRAKPDMLRDPANAEAGWNAACSYFIDRNVLTAANGGDVATATRKINGGTIGLKDREILFRRAVAAFDGKPIPAGKTTVEQADDAKRRAKQAALAAPPGGSAGGGASKQSGGLEAGQALAVGVGVFVAILAGALWLYLSHRRKQAEVEAMQLKTIEARLALAEAA